MNLIDLTQMFVIIESEMLKNTSEAEMHIGSDSKFSMDIGNGDISDPEKISLPNGEGPSKFKPFDHMVKIKACSRIVPCVKPK